MIPQEPSIYSGDVEVFMCKMLSSPFWLFRAAIFDVQELDHQIEWYNPYFDSQIHVFHGTITSFDDLKCNIFGG